MKAVAMTVILILTFLLALSGTALAYENKALILVDDQSPPGAHPPDEVVLANLLGHFDLPYEIKDVDTYTSGDIDNRRVTFYIGKQWDKDLPADLLGDILVTDRPFVWMNYNLWKLSWTDYQQPFEDRYGIRYIMTRWATGTNEVLYQGYNFPKRYNSYAETSILDTNKVETLATITEGSAVYPYIVRSGRFFFVADNPLTSKAADSSYLVLADTLHEMIGVEHASEHRALVRIEDIDMAENPQKIRAIADYLNSENVPFSMAVIPRFEDPLGAWGAPASVGLPEKPELVSALAYAESRGGTITMHGYTHQYSNVANPYSGVSGLDYEFYIAQFDEFGVKHDISPVPEDSVEWVQGRIDSGVQLFEQAGFSRPTIWVTPHYLASDLDYQVISDNFDAIYQRLTDAFFPYVLGQTVYGSMLVPENLGYIRSDDNGAQGLLSTVDRNLAIRDGFASFFYHSEVDLAKLQAAVAGIKAKGFTFVDVNSLASPLALDSEPPRIDNIAPTGTFNDSSTVVTANLADSGSGVDPDTVTVTVDGNPLESCTADDIHLSCSVSGLEGGVHAISVSAADYKGNVGNGGGTFAVGVCTGTRPSLGWSLSQTYWASDEDYREHVLSVDFTLTNNGGPDATEISVLGTENTNAVIQLPSLQAPVDVPSNGSATVTIKYLVPTSLLSFKSKAYIYAQDFCGNGFNFPGPWPGA